MGFCSITISSDNLSGQTVSVNYFPLTGGTIDLGQQVLPFTYVSDYFDGVYECYSETYNYTYQVIVP